MANSSDRSLKKILRRVLKKAQHAGSEVDPAMANILAPNLPFGNASSKKNFLSLLQEIDDHGEFPTREEGEKFLNLLGIIFFGVEFRASPQAGDGFAQIANETLDALSHIRIPGEAMQVLIFIIRKTYGYHKKTDDISLSQFVLATGLGKVAVCKAIRKLLFINLITQKGKGFTKTYQFQKDYLKWVPLPKKVTLPKKVIKSPNYYPKRLPQKKVLKKERYVEGSIELRLASLLLEEIKKNKLSIKEPNLQGWAKEFDLMMRRDGRTPQRIEAVIRWCQGDAFWWKNVLSALKLRKQFDRLEAEMVSPQKGKVSSREMPRVEYKDLTGGGRP